MTTQTRTTNPPSLKKLRNGSNASPANSGIQTSRGAIIKGSVIRKAGYPVDTMFLDRWSPRAMSGEAMPEEELKILFEAARWAPSSFNSQPWRILYARRDTEHWQRFFDLLLDVNKVWAQNAAALLVFVSTETFEFNGKPYPTHSFDTGAAWENLALQGMLKGYVVHGIGGFDYERARLELNIPEGFQIEAMVAVGKPGSAERLPEKLRAREAPNDRKSLAEIICEGPFSPNTRVGRLGEARPAINRNGSNDAAKRRAV